MKLRYLNTTIFKYRLIFTCTLNALIACFIACFITCFIAPLPLYADLNKSDFYQPEELVTHELVAQDLVPTKTLSIMCFGDLMLHGPQLDSTYDSKSQSYTFDSWFTPLISLLANSDYTIVNFESTITNNSGAYSGYPLFRSPVSIAKSIKNVGIDIAATANNHALDNRLYGVETTIDTLNAAGVSTTGTSKRGSTAAPLIIEKNGIRLGIISATYGTNGFSQPKDHPSAVNILSETLVNQQIQFLKSQHVDGIMAYIHWGNEYQRKPSTYQSNWAQKLADSGVDWIIGSHPHVVQPDEIITSADGRQVYVIYSLGNMISNQRWRYSDTGLAVELSIEATPKGLSTTITHHPFWVDKENERGQIDYTLLPLARRLQMQRISRNDQSLMSEAYQDINKLMNLYSIQKPLKIKNVNTREPFQNWVLDPTKTPQ